MGCGQTKIYDVVNDLLKMFMKIVLCYGNGVIQFELLTDIHFWAADLKGTMSYRLEGENFHPSVCMSIHPYVHLSFSLPPGSQPPKALGTQTPDPQSPSPGPGPLSPGPQSLRALAPTQNPSDRWKISSSDL